MKLLVISSIEFPAFAGDVRMAPQPVGTFHVLDLPDNTVLTPTGTISLDREDAAAFQHLLDKYKVPVPSMATPGNPMSKIREV